MKTVRIPRYVDNPMQVALWELDEIIPFCACLGLGLVLHQSMYMMAIGLFFSNIMIRAKRSNLRGVLSHMGYWNGYTGLNKRDKNGLDREFVQ